MIDGAQEGLEAAAPAAGVVPGRRAVRARGGRRVPAARGGRRVAEGAAAGERRPSGGGWVLALLIAVGIGLHNFGEGLAIGSAFALGEAALGTLLIVGFTLHNTTEGLAIVAPLARERQRRRHRPAGAARADRRRADDCRRLARRLRLLAGLVGAVPGDRRRRDRAGDRCRLSRQVGRERRATRASRRARCSPGWSPASR